LKKVLTILLILVMSFGSSVSAVELFEDAEEVEESSEVMSPSNPMYRAGRFIEDSQYRIAGDQMERVAMQDEFAERRMTALESDESNAHAELLLSELEEHEGYLADELLTLQEEEEEASDEEDENGDENGEGDNGDENGEEENGEENGDEENGDENGEGDNGDDDPLKDEEELEEKLDAILDLIQRNNNNRGERLAEIVQDDSMPEPARRGAMGALENQARAMERSQAGGRDTGEDEEESEGEENGEDNGDENGEDNGNGNDTGNGNNQEEDEKDDNENGDWQPGDGPPPWAGGPGGRND